jgi:hypothetical protein
LASNVEEWLQKIFIVHQFSAESHSLSGPNLLDVEKIYKDEIEKNQSSEIEPFLQPQKNWPQVSCSILNNLVITAQSAFEIGKSVVFEPSHLYFNINIQIKALANFSQEMHLQRVYLILRDPKDNSVKTESREFQN